MRSVLFILFIALSILFVSIGEYHKLVVLLLILFCIFQGAKEYKWYNPFYLLIVSLFSFLLYDYDISPNFLMVLKPENICLIVLCFLSIILGFGFSKSLHIKSINVDSYNENFWIIFVVGCIPTAISYALYGNTLNMSGEEMLAAKANYSIPIIGQLTYFLPASIIVACKNNNSTQIVIATVFSMIAALLTITKTAMLMTCLFLCIGLFHFKPAIINLKIIKIIKKYVLVWAPIVILYMFMYNNSIRQEAGSSSTMNYLERSDSRYIKVSTNFTEGLFLNYLYYCSPWGNLEYNIEKNRERGFGKNSFAQFGKKLGIKIEPVEKIEPSFLNTHSFITDFYLDFGYFGAIIASFILGIIIYFFYMKFGCSDDALLLSYYSLIGFATLMLFFSNHFVNGYLLNYLITFGGYFLVARMVTK